jgi:hypothetical protein
VTIPLILTAPNEGEPGFLGMLECRHCGKRTSAYAQPPENPHHRDCSYIRELLEQYGARMTQDRIAQYEAENAS